MITLKITAGRRITFPLALCEEMQVQVGDRLGVERRTVDGVDAWVLRPASGGETAQLDRFTPAVRRGGNRMIWVRFVGLPDRRW